MADDEVKIAFHVDNAALDQTASKLKAIGPAAQQGAEHGSHSLGGMLSSVTQLGFGIFGLQQTITGLTSVAKGLFSSNIQFEGFETQFSVLLGSADAAKVRLAELAKFAKDTPFELPQVVQASKVLETFGGSALSTGEGLRLVGDVASGVGQPINELAVWFGRLYDGLKSGRPVGEAMQRLQELGAISGATRGQIEDMAKAGVDGDVVWSTFAGSMGKYSGMMEKQAQTVGGAMSNISDGIGMMKRNLMAGIFEAAKPSIMALAAWLGSDGVQGAVSRAGAAIGAFAGTAITGLINGIKFAVDFIKGPGATAFEMLRKVIVAIKDALPGVLSAYAAWVDKHKVLVAAIAPVHLLIVEFVKHFDAIKRAGVEALGAIVDEFNLLKEQFQRGGVPQLLSALGISPELQTQAKEIFDGITEVIAGFFDSVSQYTTDDKMAGYWANIKDAVAGLGEALAPVGDAFISLGEATKSLLDASQPLLDLWKGQLIDIAKELWAAVKPLGDSFKESMVPALKSLLPLFASLQGALVALEPLAKMVAIVIGVTLASAITVILGAIQILIPILSTALGGAFTLVGGIIKNFAGILTGVITALTGIIDFVTGVFTGDWDLAWQGVKEIFSGVWTAIKGLIKLNIDAMVTIFATSVAIFKQIGADVINGIKKGIEEGWHLLVDAIWAAKDKAIEGIGNAKDWLVDVGWDILRGIAAGLRDGAESIIGGAMNFVTSKIPGWARKPLGIDSPSKVMRDQVGKPISEGIAVGIIDGMPYVKDAMGNMMTAIDSFISDMTGSTETGLAAWGEALQQGISDKTPMAQGAIQELFDDLSYSINDARLNISDSARSVAQSALDAIIQGFQSGAGASNAALKTIIDQLLATAKAGADAVKNALPGEGGNSPFVNPGTWGNGTTGSVTGPANARPDKEGNIPGIAGYDVVQDKDGSYKYVPHVYEGTDPNKPIKRADGSFFTDSQSNHPGQYWTGSGWFSLNAKTRGTGASSGVAEPKTVNDMAPNATGKIGPDGKWIPNSTVQVTVNVDTINTTDPAAATAAANTVGYSVGAAVAARGI